MYSAGRRTVIGLCAIGMAGILTGCATTMSNNQCVSADWYSIGLEDGANVALWAEHPSGNVELWEADARGDFSFSAPQR